MLHQSKNLELQKQNKAQMERILKRLLFITLSLLRENQKSNLVGVPLWPLPQPMTETPPMTKTYTQTKRRLRVFVTVLNHSKNQWLPKKARVRKMLSLRYTFFVVEVPKSHVVGMP